MSELALALGVLEIFACKERKESKELLPCTTWNSVQVVFIFMRCLGFYLKPDFVRTRL